MKTYIARQPIFNQDKSVYGYELLYRDGNNNSFSETDGNFATSQVLMNSFSNIGIEKITQGKKAFVNFTKTLLENNTAIPFSEEVLVVEILENIKLTRKIVNNCIELKNKDYIIALDDFIFKPQYKPLLKLADIVKVDFLITDSNEERKRMVELAKDYKVELLAEKVETRKEFKEAKEMGYSYFQGYFFKKPEIIEGKDLPVYPNNYFQVLNELNKPTPNLDKIAKTIKQDMALSYKLLRLINSAAFGIKKEVESIKQALVLLGIKEVEKWIDLVIIKQVAQDKPQEVIRKSLIRAKMAELIGDNLKNNLNCSQLFMMGLFSLLDVLMNRKLEKLLKELPIANKVKYPLLGVQGKFRDIYKLVVAYEEGAWEQVSMYTEKLDLTKEVVSDSFLTSLEWTEQVLKINKPC